MQYFLNNIFRSNTDKKILKHSLEERNAGLRSTE